MGIRIQTDSGSDSDSHSDFKTLKITFVTGLTECVNLRKKKEEEEVEDLTRGGGNSENQSKKVHQNKKNPREPPPSP